MEQHPVPRNISGFQFHLIGDMTIRQFAYLATGVLSGYFIYKTAPLSTVFYIPLALFMGFAGFAFAFLPIAERPLDKWLAAFIKSIMSPTQYIWYKNNLPLDILTKTAVLRIQIAPPTHQTQAHKEANEKLRAYLATIPTPLHESLNAAEKRYIDRTMALFNPVVGVTIPVVNVSTIVRNGSSDKSGKNITSKPISLPNTSTNKFPVEEKELSEKLPSMQLSETPKTTQVPIPKTQSIPIPAMTAQPEEDHSQIKEDHAILQNQLSRLAAEKKALELELQKLRQQFADSPTSQIVKPTISTQPQNEPTVKVVNPKSAISDMGMLNYQQAPNLIAGAIKDSQKKILPNIILTISDKSGLPVRALKTNKLGQFSAATPLPNGVYHLEVEDPMKRYVFDVAEITLSGKVFLPIEIIAKGEKELIRERLTKDLFGNASII